MWTKISLILCLILTSCHCPKKCYPTFDDVPPGWTEDNPPDMPL